MNLIGVEIYANSRWKFVGKLGIAPRNSQFSGQAIFYREVPYQDFFSHATNKYSVDRDAWDWAYDSGALLMVVFCKDVDALFSVPADEINKSPIIDLGEMPQYRIHPKAITQCGKKPVVMGYTNNVVRLPDAPAKPKAAAPTQPLLWGSK